MSSLSRNAYTNPSPTKHIAVIGGGPKAAALAAKARALHQVGIAEVKITIFEPHQIGANWGGGEGYTDGDQRLCTIAERDVAFPDKSTFGVNVDTEMAREYSWTMFLRSNEKDYSEWIDAGRQPPTHRTFAQYLRWVVEKASPNVVQEAVTSIEQVAGKWQIFHRSGSVLKKKHHVLFDAIVITGPGPAKHFATPKLAPSTALPNHLIFDGKDFWQRQDEVKKCLTKVLQEYELDAAEPIVIIGAGGTGAAILSWLIVNGARDLPIQVVTNQASLYTRVDSVFENRMFSDETLWGQLSPESQTDFFKRTNRGVVWQTVNNTVATASDLTFAYGRATQLTVHEQDAIEVLIVGGNGQPYSLRPSMLIDASGFDPWWFLSLIKGTSIAKPRSLAARQTLCATWERSVGENLDLQGPDWASLPAIHAPMVSSLIGPGYGSLMVLGAMADRILQKHLQTT